MPFFGGEQELPDKSLHELLWDSMKIAGNSTAFVDASSVEKSMTYTDLYHYSRKCTAYLQSIGITKGDLVTICAFNSLEYICVMIGILGCGATVVTCNPYYRKREILHQFAITIPKFVFVDNETVETIKAVQSETSCLEEILVMGESTEFTTLSEALKKSNTDSFRKVDIDPKSDVAFLVSSSGTTGLPKCTMLTHINIISAILLRSCCLPHVFSQSVYFDRPMYNIGGITPTLTSIVARMKTIVEKEFHLLKMFQDIENYKITGAFCLPPILVEMVNTTDNEKYDLSSLKVITSAGAVHSPNIIKQLIKKYNIQFFSAYGLTEADVITYDTILEDDGYGSCGYAKKGVELKIIDTTARECSAGAIGEITVRSPQVTKGYYGNPAATAVAIDEDGWFRTGDIGFAQTDGKLYIIDRLKEIIKYDGLQVSPAELESVIISHASVEDVGVIGIPDKLHVEVPKAFVVSSDSKLTASDVQAFVNENLAHYKQLRGGVEFAASIPKSLTGKIQRNVLKKMAGF